MSSRFKTELVERRGQPVVRISGLGGPRSFIEAWRENGMIHYSRPERVPRVLRDRVIPAMFANYDRKIRRGT